MAYKLAPPGVKSTTSAGAAPKAATAAQPVDPMAYLVGPQRDAYAATVAMLKQYGLESLAPHILTYIQNGFSSDTISLELQQTDAWKQRFAGNIARAHNGLPVLTPAQYIATESSYRQIMQDAGLPKGFYDQPSDFTDWIAKDVSPTEVKSRVDAATTLVNQADPATLKYFKQYYSQGDIIAYALDQTRAAPLVGKQLQAASIGGAAQNQGVAVDKSTAENLAANGVSTQQAQQGFGFVHTEQGNANELASIYGQQGFTSADLANEVFLNNDAVAQRRKNLASQERANFSGSAGAGRTSLATDNSGTL